MVGPILEFVTVHSKPMPTLSIKIKLKNSGISVWVLIPVVHFPAQGLVDNIS